MSGDDADGFVDFVHGLVDVAEGPLLETLGEGVVFFASNILVGFVEKLPGAMEAAGVIEAGVHGRMIVEILAVINRGLLDFVDGGVDLLNGLPLFGAERTRVAMGEMRASGAQVGQSVEIGWMAILRRCVPRREREKKRQEQTCEQKFSVRLHACVCSFV